MNGEKVDSKNRAKDGYIRILLETFSEVLFNYFGVDWNVKNELLKTDNSSASNKTNQAKK